MILVLFSLAVLYGVVAFVFLVLSSAELIDSGRSNPPRLAFAVVCSLFWPVTILVMTGVLAFVKQSAVKKSASMAKTVPAAQRVS